MSLFQQMLLSTVQVYDSFNEFEKLTNALITLHLDYYKITLKTQEIGVFFFETSF